MELNWRGMASFNTSHVVVYLILLCFVHGVLICFNTSHVVVYHVNRFVWDNLPMFQYISCCSLSLFMNGQSERLESFNTSHVVVYHFSCSVPFISSTSFNTSHVVVYQLFFLIHRCILQFQYSSCCSLSCLAFQSGVVEIEFQYISCCSLSTLDSKQ